MTQESPKMTHEAPEAAKKTANARKESQYSPKMARLVFPQRFPKQLGGTQSTSVAALSLDIPRPLQTA
eukprot:8694752-Pyramimonas_sp.AAC.1